MSKKELNFIEVYRDEEYILKRAKELPGLVIAEGQRRGLGSYNGQWLAEIPKEEGALGVIYNLEKVTHISPEGMGFLMTGFARARKRLMTFGLYGITKGVKKELEVSGLEKILPIYNTLEEAVAKYKT
ncbi:STAS domain-containing protein [Candidatus Woesearchaeota archaeon]|nr:STAS domain-containing protein [Candidatus Woesearchaeota archaeon]